MLPYAQSSLGPAPMGFLPPPSPFYPRVPLPLSPHQTPQGNLFPVPPILPSLPQLPHVPSGPMTWNFQHPMTTPFQHSMNPQFQHSTSPQLQHSMSSQFQTTSNQQRQRPYFNNKRSQGMRGAKFPTGSGPKPVLFVCTPCHKEYKSKETYDTHLATHVKCSQCDFESSKFAMHDHELMHYLPAELNFTSPEDIEKWRQERRKNFPTAERTLQKKKLQELREERGNVADTPFYRYVSRVCGSNGGNSRQRGRKHNHWVMGSNKRNTPHSGGGREGPNTTGRNDREMESTSKPPWKSRHRGSRGRGRGGRRERNINNRERRKRENSGYGLNYVSAKKPSLLEKLLANEIRVEQNTLLQCIRYLVRNNFFQNETTGERNEPDKKSVNVEETPTERNKLKQVNGAQDTVMEQGVVEEKQGAEEMTVVKQAVQDTTVGQDLDTELVEQRTEEIVEVKQKAEDTSMVEQGLKNTTVQQDLGAEDTRVVEQGTMEEVLAVKQRAADTVVMEQEVEDTEQGAKDTVVVKQETMEEVLAMNKRAVDTAVVKQEIEDRERVEQEVKNTAGIQQGVQNTDT